MKNQKGITLVALVITIIVMLILAGVTISIALNGGIISKGKNAAEFTARAKFEEALSATSAWAVADYYENKDDPNYQGKTMDEIREEMAKYDESFGDTNKYTYDVNAFTIAKNNGIGKIPTILATLTKPTDTDPNKTPYSYTPNEDGLNQAFGSNNASTN